MASYEARSRPVPITSARCSRCCSPARARQETAIVATALGRAGAPGGRRATRRARDRRGTRLATAADGAPMPRRGARAGRARPPSSRARIRRCRSGRVLRRAGSADRARRCRPRSRCARSPRLPGGSAAVDASSRSRCGASARGCAGAAARRARRIARVAGRGRPAGPGASARRDGAAAAGVDALAGGAAADALAPELIDARPRRTTRRWISRCCTRSWRSAGGRDAAALREPGAPPRRRPARRARRSARAGARAGDPGAGCRRAARRVRRRGGTGDGQGGRRSGVGGRRAGRRRRRSGSGGSRIRAGRRPLYRRALDRVATHGPATHALVDAVADRRPRRGGGGAAREDAHLGGGHLDDVRGVGAREDGRRSIPTSSGEPDKAAEHQRRLVELAPKDVGGRVRLADIEMCTAGTRAIFAQADRQPAGAGGPRGRSGGRDRAAGRGRAHAARRPDGRGAPRAARPCCADLVTQDASGLAASGLEAVAAVGRRARGCWSGSELAAAESGRAGRGGARVAVPSGASLRGRRPLRRGAGGADAAALGGRSAGARVELRAGAAVRARRSWRSRSCRRRRATSDGVLGDEAFVCFAHGEALARAGDPHGAAAAFRRALAVARTGPDAVDAALALLRIAATDTAADPTALSEALRALATACADDDRWWPRTRRARRRWCGAAGRHRRTMAAAVTQRRPMRRRACAPTWRCCRMAGGARVGAPGAVAEALVEMVLLAREDSATRATRRPWAGGRCSRARSRARGWRARTRPSGRAAGLGDCAASPALAPALSDLPAPRRRRLARGAAGSAPRARAPRGRAVGDRARSGGRARRRTARRSWERRWRCTAAVIGVESGAAGGVDRYPARGARGGDVVGEARALARMAAVVRDPERGGVAARRGGRRRTNGRGASTTRSRRSPSASSCARTIRRLTCGRTACCAPIWTRPGGRAVRRAAVAPAGGGAADAGGARRVAVRARASTG